MDFAPNECADEIAKAAAQEASSPAHQLPPILHKKVLPLSIPVTCQAHLEELCCTWKKCWKKSPRYHKTRHIDKSLPSNSFLRLVAGLDCRKSAIITQLQTSHSPLNQHLFQICQSETPACFHCINELMPETVTHFLLHCPHYQCEHHLLQCKLRRNADSVPYLLSSPIALKPLLRFIDSTKCFKFKTPTLAQDAQ